MLPPPGWGDDPLSKHMDQAAQNARTTFTRKKSQYERLDFVDRSFSTLWRNLPPQWALWPSILMNRTNSGYKAACQLVISGQITESFPNLRICIESSLYSLHIRKNDDALNLWHSHYGHNASEQPIVQKFPKSESHKPAKSISQEFKMKNLEATLAKEDPKLRPFVKKLYQQSIDHGAHPNPGAVYPNLIVEQNGDFMMQTLHGDSKYLEFGMAFAAEIGLVCLLIAGNVFPETFEKHEIGTAILKIQEAVPKPQQLQSKLLME